MCICTHAFKLHIINILTPIEIRHGVRSLELNNGQLQLFVEGPSSISFRHSSPLAEVQTSFSAGPSSSGLLWESEERQVNTLLYYLGEEAKDILASTNIGEEDRKKYDSVLAKFDSFFSVKKTWL